MDIDVASEVESEQDEEFYTHGPDGLIESRLEILAFSLQK